MSRLSCHLQNMILFYQILSVQFHCLIGKNNLECLYFPNLLGFETLKLFLICFFYEENLFEYALTATSSSLWGWSLKYVHHEQVISPWQGHKKTNHKGSNSPIIEPPVSPACMFLECWRNPEFLKEVDSEEEENKEIPSRFLTLA